MLRNLKNLLGFRSSEKNLKKNIEITEQILEFLVQKGYDVRTIKKAELAFDDCVMSYVTDDVHRTNAEMRKYPILRKMIPSHWGNDNIGSFIHPGAPITKEEFSTCLQFLIKEKKLYRNNSSKSSKTYNPTDSQTLSPDLLEWENNQKKREKYLERAWKQEQIANERKKQNESEKKEARRSCTSPLYKYILIY